MTEYYLHLGYGRTATTWLQNNIFPLVKGIAYLGKTEDSFPEWLLEWSYLDRFLLEKKKGLIVKKLDDLSVLEKVLISSEAFTQTAGIVDQIERIKSVVDEAKIIIVLREPVSLVVSKYRRLVNAGFFNEGIEQYLDYSSTPFDLVRRKRLYLHDYVFPLVIERLFSEFGQQNVLVIKYEYLVSDPCAFVSVVLRFLGVASPLDVDYLPVNKSDKDIFVEPRVIEKLRRFYASIFDYNDIPNYLIG